MLVEGGGRAPDRDRDFSRSLSRNLPEYQTISYLTNSLFKSVFRIRISFHADPDPKNVHMDPDPDPRR